MKRLLAFALMATAALAGSGALACERHLNSNQSNVSQQANGGDPNDQGKQK